MGAGAAEGLAEGLRGRVVQSEPVEGRPFEVTVALVELRRVGLHRALARVVDGEVRHVGPAAWFQPDMERLPGAFGLRVEPNSGVELVSIPAGRARIGCDTGDCDKDERPVFEVSLPAFWLARTETTIAQYRRCVGAGRCRELSPRSLAGNSTKELDAVRGLSWRDAHEFCSWIGGRLPTETEWEVAGRAARSVTYPWGEERPACRDFEPNGAKFRGSTCLEDSSLEVGRFGANPWGLFDMAGNVWEWALNAYEPYPLSAPSGESIEGKIGVVRGGSWMSSSSALRLTNRQAVPRDRRDPNVGFRCYRAGAP